MASALWLSLRRRLASFSVPNFVFTKMMTEPVRSLSCLINSSYLLSRVVWTVDCVIFAIGVVLEPTDTRTGLVRYLLDILTMFGGKVAENIRVWRTFGRY